MLDRKEKVIGFCLLLPTVHHFGLNAHARFTLPCHESACAVEFVQVKYIGDVCQYVYNIL